MAWKIQYDQKFPEWSKYSLPRIVDETGQTIVTFPQHVEHPGKYDQKANETAIIIVEAVNKYLGLQ